MFIKSLHTGPCPETSKLSPPSHLTYVRLILILISHARLGLSSGLFSSYYCLLECSICSATLQSGRSSTQKIGAACHSDTQVNMVSHIRPEQTSQSRQCEPQIFTSVLQTQFLYDLCILLFVLHSPPISSSMNLPL